MTDLHVTPSGDLVAHDTAEDCVCGPTPSFQSGGIIQIHHSLDGRETIEHTS